MKESFILFTENKNRTERTANSVADLQKIKLLMLKITQKKPKKTQRKPKNPMVFFKTLLILILILILILYVIIILNVVWVKARVRARTPPSKGFSTNGGSIRTLSGITAVADLRGSIGTGYPNGYKGPRFCNSRRRSGFTLPTMRISSTASMTT